MPESDDVYLLQHDVVDVVQMTPRLTQKNAPQPWKSRIMDRRSRFRIGRHQIHRSVELFVEQRGSLRSVLDPPQLFAEDLQLSARRDDWRAGHRRARRIFARSSSSETPSPRLISCKANAICSSCS